MMYMHTVYLYIRTMSYVCIYVCMYGHVYVFVKKCCYHSVLLHFPKMDDWGVYPIWAPTNPAGKPRRYMFL